MQRKHGDPSWTSTSLQIIWEMSQLYSLTTSFAIISILSGMLVEETEYYILAAIWINHSMKVFLQWCTKQQNMTSTMYVKLNVTSNRFFICCKLLTDYCGNRKVNHDMLYLLHSKHKNLTAATVQTMTETKLHLESWLKESLTTNKMVLQSMPHLCHWSISFDCNRYIT